jgi:hypothetical protein
VLFLVSFKYSGILPKASHSIKMRPSTLCTLSLAITTTVQAAGKTSIYIDQIPGYSALAPCAENRVSAIVRAQSSGCGDNQALTSFSCFCLDQSSYELSQLPM